MSVPAGILVTYSGVTVEFQGGMMSFARTAKVAFVAVVGFSSIAFAQMNSNVHLKPFGAKKSKSRIEVRETMGAQPCAGFANGSSCSQVCLFDVSEDGYGRKKSQKTKCMKAENINSAQRHKDLQDRMSSLEKKMNEPGFSYVLPKDDGPFYNFANEYDRQSSRAPASAGSRGSGTLE